MYVRYCFLLQVNVLRKEARNCAFRSTVCIFKMETALFVKMEFCTCFK